MRWWDGLSWTEHLALPEPDPVEHDDNVHYLDVASAAAQSERHDDGLLHPHNKDVVFAGAPRGPVPSPAERMRPDRDALLGLQGLQLFGAAVVTLTCWYLAYRGVRGLPSGDGSGVWLGVFIGLGACVPVGVRIMLIHQARTMFWWHWCASRGFQPGAATGSDSPLPGLLDRSPLLGSVDQRTFELVGSRELVGRRAVVASMLRTLPDADPGAADMWRVGVVVMPIPERVAARWAGASIRADHAARRPIVMRAMLGALVQPSLADCRAHIAAAPEQDPLAIQTLVDLRLEHYLAERPIDVDIVGDLLVVTRDGPLDDCDALDELCRDALVLHQLLVPAHELPVAARAAAAQPVEDEPAIDPTREGWGEGGAPRHHAA